MNEEWRSVVGWPNYRVSSLGRVEGPAGKILKAVRNSTGYMQVSLCEKTENGKRIVNRKIHHLVLEAFVGQRPLSHQAAHDDGSRDNNVVGNLSWKTAKQNSEDRVRHGTNGVKLTSDDVRKIRALKEDGLSIKEIAGKFGVTRDTPWRILRGDIWRNV